MFLGSLDLVLFQQFLVEFLHIMVRGNRHEKIPADRSDLVLYIALFPASLGIAEPDLETVMRAEPGKQFGLYDLLADPSSDARGIVEYQQMWNTANILEDVLQPLAYTFSCFTAEDLAESVITEREGSGQVFPAYTVRIFMFLLSPLP